MNKPTFLTIFSRSGLAVGTHACNQFQLSLLFIIDGDSAYYIAFVIIANASDYGIPERLCFVHSNARKVDFLSLNILAIQLCWTKFREQSSA